MKRAEDVFTHDEAARIVEAFEDVLEHYEVTLPSDEDDERDETNTARLYGSTYSELLDYIEYLLIEMLEKYDACNSFKAGTFSGTY